MPATKGDNAEINNYLDFLKESGLWQGDVSALKISGNYSSKAEDYQRSPYDLGWGWVVNFDHDFIGKHALQIEAAALPNHFVTLEWNSEDVTDVFASLFRDEPYDYMEMPRSNLLTANCVYDIDGSLVGCATSRCYSYSFKKTISHCVINREYSKPGTEVQVKWGNIGRPQKMIRAVSPTHTMYPLPAC